MKDKKQNKEALHAYRISAVSPEQEDLRRLVSEARDDPDLSSWLDAEEAFDRAFANKLQAAPVPADLQERILTCMTTAPIEEPVPFTAEPEPKQGDNRFWWMHPLAFGAAAAAIILLAVNFTFNDQWRPASPSQAEIATILESLETLMERDAVHQHAHPASNLATIKQLIAQDAGPFPAMVPASLETSNPVACEVVSVGQIPVGVICFEENGELMHFFTIQRGYLQNGYDSESPEMHEVDGIDCATWTCPEYLYILSGRDDENAIRRHLPI
jgi:hypothetical protein